MNPEGVADEAADGELAGFEEDFDDVEAVVDARVAEFAEVGLGGADEFGAFLGVDGLARFAVAVVAAAFDFDEGEDFAFAADEVDFVVADAEVAEEDFEAVSLDETGGDFFAVAAEGFARPVFAFAFAFSRVFKGGGGPAVARKKK